MRARCHKLELAAQSAEDSRTAAERSVQARDAACLNLQQELEKLKLLLDSARSRAAFEEQERLATDKQLQHVLAELLKLRGSRAALGSSIVDMNSLAESPRIVSAGVRRASTVSTRSETSTSRIEDAQLNAFESLKRENDRLSMQLAEQKQAQAMLLRASPGSATFGLPARGGRLVRHGSIGYS